MERSEFFFGYHLHLGMKFCEGHGVTRRLITIAKLFEYRQGERVEMRSWRKPVRLPSEALGLTCGAVEEFT